MPPSFHLGPWRVQPSLNRVSRNGDTVRLTPKAMQVLLCLVERPGEVVRREDLLDAVWPDVVVNEDVLTRAVSDLRKAFDDTPQDPWVIETIPKTGYRLIAPVDFAYAGDAAPAVVPEFNVAFPPSAAPAEPADEAMPRARRLLRVGFGLVLVAAVAGVGTWLVTRSGAAADEAVPHAPVPLTSLPGAERNPALSPDGARVAFTWAGPDGANDDIYVQMVGDAEPLRLTDDPADDDGPVWSPDGLRVAFMRYTDDGCALFVVSALGGSERKLDACGANVTGDLAWSPDGAWLAFSDRPAPGASFGIVLLNVETLERRQLTAPSGQHWGDASPSFAPDGRTLAFTRSVSHATQDVFLVPVAGGTPRRLTFDGSAVRGHAWTPDGEAVVVASNRDGPFSLWRVPAAGGRPVWIAAAGHDAVRPDLAPTGRLVYEHRTAETTLWRVPLDSADVPAPWAASTRTDQHPAFAPDGARVAFISDRSGRTELWVSRRDGSHAVRLTTFDGAFVGSPRWSPDGSRIAFDARPEGHADVYVIDAAGGSPRRLTADPSNDLAPAWSADGRRLYFGSNRTGTWQIWAMPAEGGAAVQVTTGGGYAAAETPDGAALLVAPYDRPGLLRFSIADSTAPVVPLLADRGEMPPRRWAVHASGVYFIDRTADGAPVAARLDPTAGTVTRLRPLPDARLDAGLSVSPDGAALLYVRAEQPRADLLMIEGMGVFRRAGGGER